MNSDLIFENEDELVTHVIKFFFASILEKEHFERVVGNCLTNPEAKARREHLITQGKFSLKDFVHFWSKEISPGGGLFKSMIVEELLRRFCVAHLLNRSELLNSYGLDCYQVNEPLAKFFLERDALENLAFGFSYIVRKYQNSILHLVVQDKSGDCWNGTGFLCISKVHVLTNKHVIDEDADAAPRIMTPAGVTLTAKAIYRSPDIDLALIELTEPLDARPLFPYAPALPLDEVLTMGYPRIPLAKSFPLVAHKGEINGHVDVPEGRRLLFSAKTSPGNSGGPLINRAGLVVGIVTEHLQSESALAKGLQPYFAAIPNDDIGPFILSVPKPLSH